MKFGLFWKNLIVFEISKGGEFTVEYALNILFLEIDFCSAELRFFSQKLGKFLNLETMEKLMKSIFRKKTLSYF